MSRECLFARVALSYGTRAVQCYFSATAPAGSRMTPVASSAPYVLQRLVSAGTTGIALDVLNENERRALVDISRLGIRLNRSRHPGFIALVGTVEVIDQRTSAREVA